MHAFSSSTNASRINDTCVFTDQSIDIPRRLPYTKSMDKIFAAVDLKTQFPAVTRLDTVGALVNVVIRNAFVLAGIISFLVLIFGGLGVIMSAGAGDAKKLEEGKKTITAAVVGLLLILTSVFLIQILETVTGLPILSPR